MYSTIFIAVAIQISSGMKARVRIMISLKISRLVRSLDAVSHDYLYYSVMSEAQDVMYDYLVKRDKVHRVKI